MCKYILVFSLLFFSGVYGTLIPPQPQNEAVLNGATRVAINCTSTTGATAIGWSFQPVGSSTPTQISNGGTVFVAYAGFYELEQPTGTLQNNLIIEVANESMAGTYICTEGVNALSGELIVINSDPTCIYIITPSTCTSTELFQFQKVTMVCSIIYTAQSSLVTAKMQWSSGGSPISPSIAYTSSGYQTTATSTLYQQTGYSSPFPMYNCTTTFTMNTASLPSGADTNPTSYSSMSSPFNSTIPVNYLNPGTLKITGVTDCSVNMEATVTCTIDANPPANYSWSNGNTITYGPSIQIEKTGEYTCTAWNIAGSASKLINTATGGLSQGANIGIGVVIGFVPGLVIGFGIRYFCCKKERKTERTQGEHRTVPGHSTGSSLALTEGTTIKKGSIGH